MSVDPQVGTIVQTRKPHPCGNDQWSVYRIGADIGLRCTKCDRRVMLSRREFNKAVKRIVTPEPPFTGSEASTSSSSSSHAVSSFVPKVTSHADEKLT